MKNRRNVQLAELIIQLDLLRDELYEELLDQCGIRADDLLRLLQNSENHRQNFTKPFPSGHKEAYIGLIQAFFMSAANEKTAG
ncbi:hypothetical protein [Pradoshia sp.]